VRTGTMACLAEATSDDSSNKNNSSSSPEKEKVIPRRNLTQAFDALCIEEELEKATDSSAALLSPCCVTSGKTGDVLISPTGVIDATVFSPEQVMIEETHADSSILAFDLHPELKLELSKALVNRVSFYGIVHDINKEATAMMSNDTLTACHSNDGEDSHPLVLAALDGVTTSEAATTETAVFDSYTEDSAMIDEEAWLLRTVAVSDATEPRLEDAACPATFLQAIGEKEYENSVSSLSKNSRTQLWKPSRSWWEAKSGKNPWIEPVSHNKRWRYLWPLIHYHKFLAKCIKKLKRNGVDVKQSISPVAVFLREEVCAVSDHLATVSLFDSDEWMKCLPHFKGWMDTSRSSEKKLREQVSLLKLRAPHEPSDVDSTLLRSQINEQFLQAMAKARSEMCEDVHVPQSKKKSGTPGHPPRPASQSSPSVPKQVTGLRRTRYQPPVYTPHHASHHWHSAWEQPQQTLDNSSVHSGLSVDSYPHYGPEYAIYHPHPGMQPYYHQPCSTETLYASGYNTQMYGGWMDPNAYPMQPYDSQSTHAPPSPAVSQQPDSDCPHVPCAAPPMPAPIYQSPAKYDPNNMMPVSPYWSHLDQATISMGLATPAAIPSTPQRKAKAALNDDESKESYVANAQPLLLRNQYYHGYGPQYDSPYGPMSPATQFLMSPQANFYNYGYGTPPSRPSPTAPPSHPVSVAISPKTMGRESPSTIDTTTESETTRA
jgi:hypothetical protein